ncbi:uncharacterized protein YdaU (DUF1376 family) [Polynucleobacter sphagniphilus]|uniref:DUF1376 domain-containing protein n=1 Tax=Polynucleobacter sphagniphilus TaxID=1743169 RepID=UPI002474ACCD|nr:DUF1376 domain-containing protein [Polynucleobacter sphagniphilus]MDH6241214.1 uncharacterized protein YdaU (DUF1376 family) [Polynucleobacter sphagniphilus]
MKFFKENIGDFFRQTQGMALAEIGMFANLRAAYLDSEKFLPADLEICAKLAGAKTKKEKEIAKNLILENFDLTPNGWRNENFELILSEFFQNEKAWAKAPKFRKDLAENQTRQVIEKAKKHSNQKLEISSAPALVPAAQEIFELLAAEKIVPADRLPYLAQDCVKEGLGREEVLAAVAKAKKKNTAETLHASFLRSFLHEFAPKKPEISETQRQAEEDFTRDHLSKFMTDDLPNLIEHCRSRGIPTTDEISLGKFTQRLDREALKSFLRAQNIKAENNHGN